MATHAYIGEQEGKIVQAQEACKSIKEAVAIEMAQGGRPENMDSWGTLKVNLDQLINRAKLAVKRIEEYEEWKK